MAIEHFLRLPNRQQNPETLSTDTDKLFEHLPTFIDQTNASIDIVNQAVIDCQQYATLAGQHKTAAQNSATAADASKVEAAGHANSAESAKTAIQTYVVPTEATYNTAGIDAKMQALAPYSGYVQVSKKLDNFVFKEETSFTYKVGDKSRFIKFGEKLIDAFTHASYDPTEGAVIADFSNEMPEVTEVITNGSNVTTAAVLAGDYVVDGSKLVVNGKFDTDVSSWTGVGATIAHTAGGTMEVTLTAEGRATQNINTVVGEAYLVKGNLVNDVAGQSYIAARDDSANSLANGIVGAASQLFTFTATTAVSIISAEVFGGGGSTCEFDNITGYRINNVYRAIQDAPVGTALTDTAYFEVRTQIGVTNQVLACHSYNTVSSAYEGISTEVVFDDIAKDDLVKLDTVMTKAGYTKVSDYLFSKGDYQVVPMGIWQTRNKGAHHQILNPRGTTFTYTPTVPNARWYESDGAFALTASMFDSNNISAVRSGTGWSSLTNYPDGKTGNVAIIPDLGGAAICPDNQFYDVVYPNQFIDLRPFAKVLNESEVKLIADDRLEHGVSGAVQMIDCGVATATYEYLAVPIESSYSRFNFPVGTFSATVNPTSGRLSDSPIGYLFTDGKFYDVVEINSGEGGADRVYVKMAYGDLTGATLANIKVSIFLRQPILSSGSSLSTDLIGDPANYPTILADRLASGVGAVGINPLLVSDVGDAIVPDGIIDDFKVSEKATEFFSIVKSTDSGATWAASAPTNSLITNAITMTNEPAANITLVPYSAKNKPLLSCALQPVISAVQKVIATNHYGLYQFAMIGNQISGKIQVGNGAIESKVLENVEVDENGDIQTVPAHSAIALDASTSPASKYFKVIEQDANGNIYQGVYGEEITYDGVGEWGDTDFSQLTNGTIPDINGGNDVRTFHGIIPIYGKVK